MAKDALAKIKEHQEAIKALEAEAVKGLEAEKKSLLLQIADIDREISEITGKPVASAKSGGSGVGNTRQRMSGAEADAAKEKVVKAVTKSWQTKAEISSSTGVKLDLVSRVLDGLVKDGTAQSRTKANYKGKGKTPFEYAKK